MDKLKWWTKNLNGIQWFETIVGDVLVTVERRPPHCDRGNYYAKIFSGDPHKCWIDDADGFPRYYFDLAVAKSEMEAFLVKRGVLK